MDRYFSLLSSSSNASLIDQNIELFTNQSDSWIQTLEKEVKLSHNYRASGTVAKVPQLTVLAITCLNVCLVSDHGAGAVRRSHLRPRRRVGVGTGKVVAEYYGMVSTC